MNPSFTPPDVVELTEKYKIERGGICGQACLAVITLLPVQTVLDEWKEFGLEFKGYSTVKQLRTYLQMRGYKATQCTSTSEDPRVRYIARIQWIGDGPRKQKPFYGWGHWSIASAWTHFILIEGKYFFCNETGWMSINALKEYLGSDGVITSYLRVEA